jgi:hypothetical protein
LKNKLVLFKCFGQRHLTLVSDTIFGQPLWSWPANWSRPTNIRPRSRSDLVLGPPPLPPSPAEVLAALSAPPLPPLATPSLPRVEVGFAPEFPLLQPAPPPPPLISTVPPAPPAVMPTTEFSEVQY